MARVGGLAGVVVVRFRRFGLVFSGAEETDLVRPRRHEETAEWIMLALVGECGSAVAGPGDGRSSS